jgi:hypothetical protein
MGDAEEDQAHEVEVRRRRGGGEVEVRDAEVGIGQGGDRRGSPRGESKDWGRVSAIADA